MFKETFTFFKLFKWKYFINVMFPDLNFFIKYILLDHYFIMAENDVLPVILF